MSVTRGSNVPEVLVAGAGPVGLAMAHELARRGIPLRLIDAKSEPATTSRAIATHPRTLEAYDQMGVIEEMLKRGREIRAFTLFQDGRRLARLDADYSTMPTRFPFTLAIEQTATEEVFRNALADLGVKVEWGVKLTDVAPDDEGVSVELEHADGRTESARVPWLVGCDGGHSTVRKKLDLKLIGEENQTWLLADAPLKSELPPNSIYWVRAKGGTMMAVPLADDRWRLLDTAETDYDGDPSALAARFERKLTQGLGHQVRVGTPTWVSRFTAQQRMVPRMRSGRALVAGDAAHVHSPASGQGMNTGIQEAVNLAWKLTMVIEGHAREELLDSYADERVPVGEALLESTKKATQMIELRSRFTNLALPVIFGVVSRVAPIRKRMQREMLGGMSGLLLSYAERELTAKEPHRGAGPAPGTRVTEVDEGDLTGTGWPVLLDALRRPGWLLVTRATPGEAAQADALDWVRREHGGWLTTLTVTDAPLVDGEGTVPDADGRVSARLGLAPGGWLLVRPDAYLLARGESLSRQALAGALQRLPLTSPVAGAR
ncbi:FAD-dependent monooxygenase [Streptomyces triticirhizae]|uniref:FAD-dependent oxidoreductase n=1 Tax=Streptomyces triticirhizae TaxID=2483353 RepID=A0A3M2LMN9_9ACTN|nr:FAD-dependent monooxygenase [Streptomyces triticirhizae]RMI36028.1 FAD-dependent oxidoreductase [Streptomyces triticirhizae]